MRDIVFADKKAWVAAIAIAKARKKPKPSNIYMIGVDMAIGEDQTFLQCLRCRKTERILSGKDLPKTPWCDCVNV